MIRFGIVGYGNLGKACEKIAFADKDFELAGIFTRRAPESMSSPFGTRFFKQDELESFAGGIDVLALCTGSANDVTSLGLRAVKNFNTVDSFDTHAKMREYALAMDAAAQQSGRLAFVGIGWDPGLFSIMRALFDGVLPNGNTQTFWGRGVSQGHSEAVRRIEGVETAVQYTIPKQNALDAARAGSGEALSVRDKHLRECFVVAKADADRALIEKAIKEMPNYFSDYDTVVHFISKEEFDASHTAMPHGGFVMRGGEANGMRQNIELSLKLDSNPDFTGSVLTAYAKANAKMFAQGARGAKTALDIPVSALLDGEWADIVQRYV